MNSTMLHAVAHDLETWAQTMDSRDSGVLQRHAARIESEANKVDALLLAALAATDTLRKVFVYKKGRCTLNESNGFNVEALRREVDGLEQLLSALDALPEGDDDA